MLSLRNPALPLLLGASLFGALAGCESNTDEVDSPQMHLSSPGHLDGIAPGDPHESIPRFPGFGPQPQPDPDQAPPYYLV